MSASLVTLSLTIHSVYELYPPVTSHVTADVPVPPTDVESSEYDEWLYVHIHSLTGNGRPDGDSWYDLVVTESSDPTSIEIGRKFDFGY